MLSRMSTVTTAGSRRVLARRPRAGGRLALRGLLHAAAAVAACVAVIVAVVTGTGWLYLLRGVHGLAFGPHFQGALPLQQLAGGDTQPLGRMVAAWLPTGLALGMALTVLTRIPRWARATIAAVGAAILLLAAAAVSDAVAQNDAVRAHVSATFGYGGVWLSVALVALGVLVAPPWAPRRAP
jgi:hypothetical protein